MGKKAKRRKKMKKLRLLLWLLCGLVILGIGTVVAINSHVTNVGGAKILSVEEAAALADVDCIIVLGCQVKEDGTLSHMLRDRVEQGLTLYRQGAAPKLLMSGDHGTAGYDEVNAMKGYAVDAGVPSEVVFMDHAGFSTYETVYRAKAVFEAKKVVIVTQRYHLYRAVYIAGRLGLEAYGVSADLRSYAGQTVRDCREVLARCKDFLMTIWKPEPTYLGEAIPVSGNGDLTNDS